MNKEEIKKGKKSQDLTACPNLAFETVFELEIESVHFSDDGTGKPDQVNFLLTGISMLIKVFSENGDDACRSRVIVAQHAFT